MKTAKQVQPMRQDRDARVQELTSDELDGVNGGGATALASATDVVMDRYRPINTFYLRNYNPA